MTAALDRLYPRAAMNDRTTARLSPRSPFARSCCVAAVLLSLAACGSDPAPTPPEVIGILELPVSHRGAPRAPTGAARVDIGQTQLRLDDHLITGLTLGELAVTDVTGGAIPKLRAALAGGRTTALLYVNSGTPYGTTVAVLKTLRDGGVRNAVFAVRRVPPPRTKGQPPVGPSMTASFLEIRDFQIVPESDEEIVFPGITPVPWADVAAQWDAMQGACSTSSTADCMWKPVSIAVGGNAKMMLRSSGDGLQVQFYQVGAPVVELAPGEIPDAGPPVPPGAEPPPPPPPPATMASFTLRSEAAILPESPVSGIMRSVCGSRACGVVVVSDHTQITARVIGLIGAAFPEGSAPPNVAFQTPRPLGP
jgi:hypothetical protein